MKIVALVSGGKDSIFALDRAIQAGHKPVCIVAIKSENPESYMFHVPAIELVKLQAKAMNLSLIWRVTKGEKEVELDDLKDALEEAKEVYGAEGVVSGALASKYQKDRIDKICAELNLTSITPLWGIDPDKYMDELLASGFKVVIAAVAADGLDDSWIGKEIDMRRLNKLKELAKKYRFNIAFEGGEAETLVLDCPLFDCKKLAKVGNTFKLVDKK